MDSTTKSNELPYWGWMQTYTGKQFFPHDPTPESICLEDIAHGLSQICRYGGQSLHFYSVAQHCCMVSDFLPLKWKLLGLMHDAAEAYVGDMVRSIKHAPGMESYRAIEKSIEAVIFKKFGLDWATPEDMAIVKQYDIRALCTERLFIVSAPPATWSQNGDAFPISHLDPWTPKYAEWAFKKRYEWTLEQDLSYCDRTSLYVPEDALGPGGVKI